MHCEQCKIERSEKDFFGKTICYKCTYLNKSAIKVKMPKEPRLCKLCSNPICKSRWAYCSPECQVTSANIKQKNYWYRKIKAEKIKFKQ